jgi:hypothetical protein
MLLPAHHRLIQRIARRIVAEHRGASVKMTIEQPTNRRAASGKTTEKHHGKGKN